jgi:DNA-binding HxlR family transcriptional regulator
MALGRRLPPGLASWASPLEKTVGKRKPTAMDGLIDRVTGLRVLIIIVEITRPVETRFTNCKRSLGEIAETALKSPLDASS